ncbi:MAG: hypothetical protein Ct9H300mP11_31520 [Chloroflexota bacterium]|nr:MAG: hypothetical protein Ct9H300mP11_31520 [Chloroflexota bacterium]
MSISSGFQTALVPPSLPYFLVSLTYAFSYPDIVSSRFRDHLEYSMLGRAVKNGIVSIDVTDIRDYAHDPHHTQMTTSSVADTACL